MPYCTVKLYKGVPMSPNGKDFLIFAERGAEINEFLESYSITGDVTPYDADGGYIPFNESMNSILFSPSRDTAPLTGTNGSAKNVNDIRAVNYLKVSLYSRVGARTPARTIFYFVTSVSISSEMERGTAESDDAGGFVWRLDIERDIWTSDIWQRNISADENIKISGGVLFETTIDETTFPNGLSAKDTAEGKYAAMSFRRTREETHDGATYTETATSLSTASRGSYLIIAFLNLGVGKYTTGKTMSEKIAVIMRTDNINFVADAAAFLASTNKVVHSIRDQVTTYDTAQVFALWVVPLWFFSMNDQIPFQTNDTDWVFYRESGGYGLLPVAISPLTRESDIKIPSLNLAYGGVPPKVFVGDLYNRKEVRRKPFKYTTTPSTDAERANTFCDNVKLTAIFDNGDPSLKILLNVGESITDLTNDFALPVPSLSESASVKDAEDQARGFSILNNILQAAGSFVTGGLLGGAPGAIASGIVGTIQGVSGTIQAATQKNPSPQASQSGSGYAIMNCRKNNGLFYSFEVGTTSQNEEDRALARWGVVSGNGLSLCGVEYHPFRRGTNGSVYYCYSKIGEAEIYAPMYPQFVADFLKQKFNEGIRIWKRKDEFASPNRGSIASRYYSGLTNDSGEITR